MIPIEKSPNASAESGKIRFVSIQNNTIAKNSLLDDRMDTEALMVDPALVAPNKTFTGNECATWGCSAWVSLKVALSVGLTEIRKTGRIN